MAKKPVGDVGRRAPKAELRKTLDKPHPPFEKLRGASPFAVASDHATKEQVAKAQQFSGALDAARFVGFYEKTENPIWLWMALNVSPPDAVPAGVMTYLRACSRRVSDEVIDELKELERVRVEVGKSPEEGIVRQPRRRQEKADVSRLLLLSHPGRNLIQEASKDFAAVSIAVAAEHLIKNNGCTLNKAYVLLATSLGRVSDATGPGVQMVGKMVDRGRKLLGFHRGTGA